MNILQWETTVNVFIWVIFACIVFLTMYAVNRIAYLRSYIEYLERKCMNLQKRINDLYNNKER